MWLKNRFPKKELDIHRKIDKMKKQRAIYQMKEQDKTPEKQLNEMEIGNLPEKEFTIIIVNSFSGRLPISISFNCFSGVLSCSFIWYIALCLFILSFFLWMWFSFHRLQDCSSSCFCCLPSGGCGYLRGLCKLPEGRDWWWVELGVVLVGWAQ